MRRIGPGMGAFVCSLLALQAALAADRVVRLQAVDPGKPFPPEMVRPEGRTRWDLTGIAPGQAWTRVLEATGKEVVVQDAGEVGPDRSSARSVHLVDPSGGDAALRWAIPDRYPDDLRPGSRREFALEERSGGGTETLRVDVETVGVGWVHLPSGPREVALERALVTRESSSGSPAVTLVHRWVDPRAGVVAEISGLASPDRRGRLQATDASVAVEVLLGAADLKIYADELWLGNYRGLNYAWDKGSGTAISSLTSPSYSTMGNLIAASSWNFSGVTSGTEVASSTTPVNSSETCNSTQCGYSSTGVSLERTDRSFNVPANLDKTNDVAVREDRANDVTIWIRAGAQHEGKSGTFGSGESRFCYYGTDLNGKVRTQIPLWRFSHQDAAGWYFQAGDTWGPTQPFNCEQNIFNQLCGASQFLDKIYVAGSSVDSQCAHTGKQYSEVVKGGVVTLPSGHTFNSLVVRQIADFCVYLASSCLHIFKADEVRTYVYLWQVPHLGSVIMLQSPQTVADGTSFTTLNMTQITYGLYPPRTITVTGSTADSVSLSWDPGLDTHRIGGYKVYWDTDSGGSSGYAFNSTSNPGQVAFSGTTATVSGLAGGTTYYFTVTSLSTYTDPSSGVVTAYESLVYPTQVYGDPSYVYPIEVQAATTAPPCTPGATVTGLTENRLAPGGIHFCWNADATDTGDCLVGYRLLVSNGAQSRTAFVPLQDTTGTETCADVSPYPGGDQNLFLVVAVGTGGEGPRGE
jgi:hypothetical protein